MRKLGMTISKIFKTQRPFNKLRDLSTHSCNNNIIIKQLNDVLTLRQTPISSWIVETHLKTLCTSYKNSSFDNRKEFLITLAHLHTVNYNELINIFNKINIDQFDTMRVINSERKLYNLLIPQYHWIFTHIGRIENGVKFLADLRIDIRKVGNEMNFDGVTALKLQQLNSTLMELLSLWFSVGFLQLQRVTWKSSCEMLEKVSEYEKVHPIRNWGDLKRRVGPYRRCFVFTHNSMPGEPLVVLHTALSDQIYASMKSITTNHTKPSTSGNQIQQQVIKDIDAKEDPSLIKAAIFYSINSTQDGLHGIELGNYLIKEVVNRLKSEFPGIEQFSSLSPIPKFKNWLYEKFKQIEKTPKKLQSILKSEEIDYFQRKFQTENICQEFRRHLNNNDWLDDGELIERMREPLMRLCAYYLYLEKRRNYAFDSVANFHLRNGAVMWRLNWLADTSARGLTNSCGMMINYRYFLDDTEINSRNYIEKHLIQTSQQIQELTEFFLNRTV